MRLHLNERLYRAGAIETSHPPVELEAIKLGIEIGQTIGDRTPVSTGCVSELSDTGDALGDSFTTYDPLAPMQQAGPDREGRYRQQWTRRQVTGLASYTLNAARLANDMRQTRIPGVLNPLLSTVLAVAEADSTEEVRSLVRTGASWWTFNPSRLDLVRPEDATPSRIVCVGFAAANAALCHVIEYDQAIAVVEEFNASLLAI